MGKLPYQLITNTISFLGEHALTKVLEDSSYGPATEGFASIFIRYSEAMQPPWISRTE